jgi:hypothetical protein
MIHRTKWGGFGNLEFVRRVQNGVSESALTSFASARSNDLNFIDLDHTEKE